MGTKFKIFKHRKRDSLHLRLMGEFDDISICELIDVLKTDCSDTCNVFIHTDNIDTVSISGIGRDVFKRNLNDLTDNAVHIEFTGSSENKFVSKGNYL